MAGEQSAEDELVISFTEDQQTLGSDQPEEIPASQNQYSENTITRFGRVCNPPNKLKDYMRHWRIFSSSCT